MRVKTKTLPLLSYSYPVLLAIALLAAAVTHVPSVNAEKVGEPMAKPMIVYKSPSCGCCGAWVDHMEQEGFNTSIKHPNDLNSIKQQLGIAPRHQSCHTATLEDPLFGRYIFEGHIPADVIQHFLNNAPSNALGLAVPGMPMGSPGMDTDREFLPYTVLQLNNDGSSTHYATVSADQIRYMEKN